MSQRMIPRVFVRAFHALPDDRLVRWMIAGILVLATIAAAAAAQARSAPESFANLAERLLPSVVNISTTQTVRGHPGIEMPQFPPGSPFEEFFKRFFDPQSPGQPERERRATSLGSGFLIENGYVLTNNHVIEGADRITVSFHDDSRIEAKVVGRDPKTDIAVLKLQEDPKNGFKPLKLGNSDSVRVGDWVIAIGNPFGLGGTVTAGIVSARGRDINAGPYDDFIQTDASINKGNSGGPMFNMDGEVIGINTAIYSPSGGSVGIGFAMAINVQKPVIDQLIEFGRTKRGWLGVRIQNVTEEIADSIGLDRAYGALVAMVDEGGPAGKAGVEAGDVILTFDGREVTEMRRLPRMVAETPIDKEVAVSVWRKDESRTLTVKIGELDETEVAARTESGSGEAAPAGTAEIDALGLTVSGPTAAVRERYSLGEGEIGGLVVVGIDPEGPAARKRIQEGDVIVEVNQQEIKSAKDIERQISEARDRKRSSVMLFIERQGDVSAVGIRLKDE